MGVLQMSPGKTVHLTILPLRGLYMCINPYMPTQTAGFVEKKIKRPSIIMRLTHNWVPSD